MCLGNFAPDLSKSCDGFKGSIVLSHITVVAGATKTYLPCRHTTTPDSQSLATANGPTTSARPIAFQESDRIPPWTESSAGGGRHSRSATRV